MSLHLTSRSTKDFFLFLDEPDSHLHQTNINKITDIIKKSLVEGLGFQVFLTTHNDKTVAYLDRNIDTSGTEANCFIMKPSSEDGPVKISKYTESLGAKLLLDNFYITMIASGKMSVKAHQSLIVHFSKFWVRSCPSNNLLRRTLKRRQKDA